MKERWKKWGGRPKSFFALSRVPLTGLFRSSSRKSPKAGVELGPAACRREEVPQGRHPGDWGSALRDVRSGGGGCPGGRRREQAQPGFFLPVRTRFHGSHHGASPLGSG